LTTDQADRCGQATAKGDRSEAMLSTLRLSGEWEVPVTRNAKITPVNEGGGGRGSGGPPLRDHLWQGPPLPVTLRLIHPPPKMTQGVMTPLTPPSSPSTASLSGVARCWHSNAYSSLFSSLFFDFHRTNFSRFRRTFHSFDPVGFAIFANPAPTQPHPVRGWDELDQVIARQHSRCEE